MVCIKNGSIHDVITDGCPFEVSTNVEYVLIDGNIVKEPK